MSTQIQRSFSNGEISPALRHRVDLAKFTSSLQVMRNAYTRKATGASNRPGTKFIGEVKSSASDFAPRLIPFRDATGADFLIEFGSLYLRVIKDGAHLTDLTKIISGVVQSPTCQITTTTAHTFSNGDEITVSGIIGMTELNGRNFKVANVTTNSFTIKAMDGTTDIDSTAFTAWVSGGTVSRIFTLVHTFNELAPGNYTTVFRTMTYSQWGDRMVFASNTEVISELQRTYIGGDIGWAWANMSFGAIMPAPASPTNNGAAGATYTWLISAVSHDGEEGPASAATTSSTQPTPGTPITLGWTAVTGAREYNIYRGGASGYYGWIGTAFTNSFVDSGFSIDLSQSPYKTTAVPWLNGGLYPGVVAHGQQRRLLARDALNSVYPNGTSTVWTSKIGAAENFYSADPIMDSDPVTFTLASSRQSRINHIVDLFKILIFTDVGELYCEGNENNIITPTAINTRQISYNGSSYLRPLLADNKVLYVQERGNIVHDIVYEDGRFTTDELSLWATHLLEGREIVSWAYQKTPDSVVWMVRDDGVLVGITYIKKQDIIAFHRHDFGSDEIKEIECIPELKEHAVYMVIERTINGAQKRYIERFTPRFFDDVKEFIFMDSALTFDGRNTGATTMTISGGTTWVYTETLTLTASVASFLTGDVGNEIQLQIRDSETGEVTDVVRCEITAYTSSTVVSVRPHKTVPAALRSTATAYWVRAVDEVTGLWHLEGKDVSVLGDGFVVASPNNPAYTVVTVANGRVTLDRPFGVIHVGLPYVSDIETLDIDSPNTETLADKKKLITELTLHVENTRGIFAGNNPGDDSLDGLYEAKVRDEEFYDDPVELRTGEIDVKIQSEWNSNGRVLVRQVDPLPFTINSIAPAGVVNTR